MDLSAAGEADSLAFDYDRLVGAGATVSFTLSCSVKDFQAQYMTETTMAGIP